MSNSSGAITVSNTYNSRLQPSSLSASANGLSVLSLAYDFHAGNGDNGNVFQIANGKDDNRTQNFSYDKLNRIQQAWTNGPNWGETFTLDPWGNLTNRTAVTGKTNYEPLSAAASNQNQLTGFSYDAAGNLTNNGGAAYTYDGENRISAAGGLTYVYDGDGNRVHRVNGTGGTLDWRDTNGEVLDETSVADAIRQEYIFFNGKRIARHDYVAGKVDYYFSDHLGSASVVTDSAGNITDESDYYPYGGEIVITNNDTNHFKFTGKERDGESGLDNFGARYNASSLGRFMTPDWAAKPTTVPYAKFGDPQTLNLYAYVTNNPLGRTDPDGHCADHYDNGSCKVNVDAATGQAGASAGKQLEGVLNKYDKAINALNDKDKFKIRDSKGKVIGTMTGKEIKAVWNGTSFTVTNKSFNNGGEGGTSGKWNGDSFSGRSELTPKAVSDYANAASARNEAQEVGLNSLTFHELGHETHFGEALTGKYPVTPTLSWPREQGTSSAGHRMSDAVGAPFDCSIPGGCQ